MPTQTTTDADAEPLAPRKNWPIFVRRQVALLEMMHSRNWRTTYQRLRSLSGDVLTLTEEALIRERQRVGIK